jgi:parallel beta-helix repeat protein
VLSDCLIKGAKTGITVKGGTPVLENLELVDNKVGIEIRGKAGGKVTGSKFRANEKVGLFVKEDSTTAVSDCRFTENKRYGAYLYRARPQLFSGNTFFGNEVALMVAYHGSDSLVEGNRFEQNKIAIQVDRAARPTLKGNHLLNNKTGLYAYRRSDPVANGNRFQGNDVGVLVAYSSYPQIEGNDFVDNGLAIKLEFQSSQWESAHGEAARASETASRSAFSGQGMRTVSEDDRKASNLKGLIEASHNWWGVKGTAELKAAGEAANPGFIHDGRDQATFVDAGKEYPLDKVVFAPWSETPQVVKIE